MEVCDVPKHLEIERKGDDQQLPAMKEKQKPVIILLHGSLHAAWCFRYFQTYFAHRGYQTFSVSLRGAGKSEDGNAIRPSIEQHVDDLSAFLTSLNLDTPPIIIAHSMGGLVAQRWVQQQSFLPAKLVLLASVPPTGNSAMTLRIFFDKGLRVAYMITMGFIFSTCATKLDVCREMFFSPKGAPGFSESIEGDEVLLEYMELFKLTKKKLDPKSLRSSSPMDRSEHTRKLSGRVLVLSGSADIIVDEKGVHETAEFWDTTAHIVPGAPHDLMLYSGWEEVASGIWNWLETGTYEAIDTLLNSTSI